MTTTPVRNRRRRADAVENEDRVRQAAKTVVRRRGQSTTMDEVALEAVFAAATPWIPVARK